MVVAYAALKRRSSTVVRGLRHGWSRALSRTPQRPDTPGPHGPFGFAQGRLARAPVPTRAAVPIWVALRAGGCCKRDKTQRAPYLVSRL